MSSNAGAGAAPAAVDLNRLGRQVGVFGLEASSKLVALDVLIIGLKGLGVEVAKNVILAGPRSVTLFDPEPATIADTGSNVSGERGRGRFTHHLPEAPARPTRGARPQRPPAATARAASARPARPRSPLPPLFARAAPLLRIP